MVSTPVGGRSRQEKTPKILHNVACGKGVIGCGADGKGRRGWNLLKTGAKTLDSVKDARGIAFLDLDEDVSVLVLCS